MSEADLLSRARKGEALAFAEVCAPFQRRAFNLALRLCGDAELAADVCQESFLRAFTSLDRLRADTAFSTWLLRIVHNLCLDALRRQARRPNVSLEDQLDLPADPGPGPEDAILRRERQALLLSALARLRPDHRAAVVLHDVQGLSYEEVAAIVGVPVGTVKSRLHRAHAELRELLRGSSLFARDGAAEQAPR